jgi:hypothetical protein
MIYLNVQVEFIIVVLEGTMTTDIGKDFGNELESVEKYFKLMFNATGLQLKRLQSKEKQSML